MSFLKNLSQVFRSPEVQLALFAAEVVIFVVKELCSEDKPNPPRLYRR